MATRRPLECPEVTEAEGYKLHLSTKTDTGYKGVLKHKQFAKNGKYIVQ